MKIKEGLLGTIGLLMKPYHDRYDHYPRVGWDGNSNNITEVDFVGHAWFFKREWIKYFLREIPNIDENFLLGEDIHFSYSLQKYATNIKTYVPPHPANDTSLWGSQRNTAMTFGTDKNAVSQQSDSLKNFDKIFQKYRSKGFKVIADDTFKI